MRQAADTAGAFPAERTVLRPFTLPDQRGRLLDLGRFRQQRNLVLLFLNKVTPVAESLLQGLGEKQAALAEEEAVVVAILHGSPKLAGQLRERLQIPFPVLADEAGELVSSFAGPNAALYVTDRFREIFACCHDDRLFTPDEVLEWLAHINRQCPE